MNNAKSDSNSFLATLQRHRGGGLLSDASEKLAQLVAAVALAGKGGTLTIKLQVKPATRGQAAVVLQDEITTRAPKLEPEASFWFATDSGELRKDDPRQTEFPLSVQNGGAPEAEQKRAIAAV